MILYLQPLISMMSCATASKIAALFFNDLIAQLVEHLPFKEVVLGSSPSQVTKKSRYFYRLFGFFWHLPRCWNW